MTRTSQSPARPNPEEPTLASIREPIAEAFERFQERLDDAFLCDVSLVGAVQEAVLVLQRVDRAHGTRPLDQRDGVIRDSAVTNLALLDE